MGWRGGELEIGVSNGLSCGSSGGAEFGEKCWWVLECVNGGRPAYQHQPVAGILHERRCEEER